LEQISNSKFKTWLCKSPLAADFCRAKFCRVARPQGVQSCKIDFNLELLGTDGQISVCDLFVLEDDKGLFPPYQVAPIVRQEVQKQEMSLGTH
jgi:Substrate binding domain of ABC-type glycine betaine transport system